MRIAVVQLDAERLAEPRDDLPRVLGVLGEVARSGCEIVVLPEYASGWRAPLGDDLSEGLDGPFVTAMCRTARENAMTIVVGTLVPTSPGRATNLTLVIGPDGAIAGEYAKVHRYDAFGARESDLLDGGDPAQPLNLLVPTRQGPVRLGVITCYDLRFPESVRALVDATGAPPPDLIAVGAAWASGPGKAETLRVLARARAIESTAVVALASQCGRGRVGGSAIIDARGTVVAQADDGADSGSPSDLTLVAADVDLTALRPLRAALPVWEHRRYRVVPAE